MRIATAALIANASTARSAATSANSETARAAARESDQDPRSHGARPATSRRPGCARSTIP